MTSDAFDSAISGCCDVDAAKSGLCCVDAAKSGCCDVEPAKFESTSDDPPSNATDADSVPYIEFAPGGACEFAENRCSRRSINEDFIIESSNMESVGCSGCRARYSDSLYCVYCCCCVCCVCCVVVDGGGEACGWCGGVVEVGGVLRDGASCAVRVVPREGGKRWWRVCGLVWRPIAMKIIRLSILKKY